MGYCWNFMSVASLSKSQSDLRAHWPFRIYVLDNIWMFISETVELNFQELFVISKCPSKHNPPFSREFFLSEIEIFPNFGLLKLLMHSKIDPEVKPYDLCLKIQWSDVLKREGINYYRKAATAVFEHAGYISQISIIIWKRKQKQKHWWEHQGVLVVII